MSHKLQPDVRALGRTNPSPEHRPSSSWPADGTHLVLLPHGAQGLHLVLAVLALLQALVADGAAAAHAVHAVVLQVVLGARRQIGRAHV